MTLIRGHDRTSLSISESDLLSSVHGQPDLPAGGGGSSVNFGQRTLTFRPLEGYISWGLHD